MEILGVDRDENAHSKFLGWLFENEDTREVAIKSLLVLLKDNTHFPRSLYEINWDTFSIKDTKVTLEDFVEVCGRNESGNKVTDKNGNEIKYYGRADIVIDVSSEINSEEKSFHIIIENKIDSFEHKMGRGQKYEDAQGALWQTVGYYYYYKEKYGEENCVFVFLTRPNIDEKKCIKFFKDKSQKNNGRPQCDSFIWINYQNVLDSILVKVLDSIKESLKGTKQTKDSCTSLSEITIRINDYIRCLGINKTQENLMAISSDSEIAKLADEIWNSIQEDKIKSNQNIIRPLFEVLYYLHHNPKKNGIIDSIYGIVNDKDYTTYSIEGIKSGVGIDACSHRDSGLTKNALIMRVVELYLKEKGDKNIKEVFPPALRMVCKGALAKEESLSNQVIIELEEYIQKKNEYKKSKNQEPLTKESAKDAINKDDDWKELNVNEALSGLYVIQTGWDGKIMMNNFIEHVKQIMPEYTIKEQVHEDKLNKIINIIRNADKRQK